MATKKSNDGGSNIVNIQRPTIGYVEVPIVGIEPLIVHAWSQKARAKMLEAQQVVKGVKAKRAKEPRNPEEDFQNARYVFRSQAEEWDGFPATGFKAAMVDTCRLVAGLSMTEARRALFVESDGHIVSHNPFSGQSTIGLVRIHGSPTIREDCVRINNGKSTDLAYRPQYFPWSAVLRIKFNASMLSVDAVVNLLATAGQFEGVGEWRPGSKTSNSGQMGLWEIDESKMG